jgi:hypothetical protein
MHSRAPGPNKTLRADAHTIADCVSRVLDEVKEMTAGIDNDRSRLLVCRIGDDLTGERGINPSRLFPRHRKNAGIGRLARKGRKNQHHNARYASHDPHFPQPIRPELDFHNAILKHNGRVEHRSVPDGWKVAVALPQRAPGDDVADFTEPHIIEKLNQIENGSCDGARRARATPDADRSCRGNAPRRQISACAK